MEVTNYFSNSVYFHRFVYMDILKYTHFHYFVTFDYRNIYFSDATGSKVRGFGGSKLAKNSTHAHINTRKEDQRIDRTNTRRARGSFSHRRRSPRQPARWLFAPYFGFIVTVHVVLCYQAVGSPGKTAEYPKGVHVLAATAELVRFAWCGYTGQQFLDKCLIFAHFCCGRVETQHAIYLWLNSQREPSHGREPCSHSDFTVWRRTHFTIMIWALYCSGFTVWIKFKQAHANIESPLTLFCTDKLCHGRCVAMQ